jgi:hypothetical protein
MVLSIFAISMVMMSMTIEFIVVFIRSSELHAAIFVNPT